MALSLPALKTELLTDPTGLGYAGPIASGITWQLADLINATTSSIQIFRSSIPTWEVIACTDMTEYTALTANNKQMYQTLVSAGTVSGADSRIRSMFGAIFAAGTTRTALLAMASRNGSRAEQLFGTAVSASDCSAALGS
jgi:hypothetical protein